MARGGERRVARAGRMVPASGLDYTPGAEISRRAPGRQGLRTTAKERTTMLKRLIVPIAALLVAMEAAAQTPASCDRACLESWVDRYLVAMRDGNVDPDLFARDVKFTENGVRLPLGNEGLWYAMSGIGNYKFYVPDVETQQVAFIGTVRENGTGPDDGDLVAIALRLRVTDGRITEVEQLAIRPSSVNSSRG